MENTFADFIIKKDDGCWEWTGARYPGSGWCGKTYGRWRHKLAHRHAYEVANGPIPKGLCACHTCDNRLCVNPDHLWLGTRQENNRDRDEKGRAYHPIGELHPRAKLNREKVAEIRAAKGKITLVKLASMYGVSETTVRDAQSGRNWA